jgi:hypothetical protein
MPHGQDAVCEPKLGAPTFVEQLSALYVLLLSCQSYDVNGQDHSGVLVFFWLAF